MTGGTPYLATDTRALAQRFQNILEDLEKSRIKDAASLYAELYPRFLWPAFCAAAARDRVARSRASGGCRDAARPSAAAVAAADRAGRGDRLRARRSRAAAVLERARAPALIAAHGGVVSVARKVVRAVYLTVALALLVLALARPQAGGRAKLDRAARARSRRGARLFEVDAGARRLSLAARARQARARAADRSTWRAIAWAWSPSPARP